MLTKSWIPLLAMTATGCVAITGFGEYEAAGDGSVEEDGGRATLDAEPDGEVADAEPDAAPRDAGGGTGEGCAGDCGTSGECMAGRCSCGGGPACAGSEVCCDGECVDLASSPDHCGACGAACPDGERATRTCVAGACGYECLAGFADCDGEATPGCETDLAARSDCGACGRTCAATEVCSGSCTSACGSGETECDGSCVDTDTSLSHCGGCGERCPSLPNTTVTCEGGSCAYECVGGYQDCNGDLSFPSASDGCETVPPLHYPDGDSDGFGERGATGTRLCPGAAAGMVTNDADCDDGRDTVFPGATETCNGLDDDCDGTRDDGFECAAGDSESCTTACGAGTRVCNESCLWTGCGSGTEICNRADDDCDGFVDEGLVTPMTRRTVVSTDPPSALSLGIRADTHEMAVMWSIGVGDPVTYSFRFHRADEDGAPVGAMTVIGSSSRYLLPQMGWGGAEWIVAMTDGPDVRYIPVSPTGAAGSSVYLLESAGTYTAWGDLELAQGDGRVGLTWREKGSSGYRVRMAVVGPGGIEYGPKTVTTSASFFRRGVITHLGGTRWGVLVPEVEDRTTVYPPSTPARLHWAVVDTASDTVTGPSYLLSDTTVTEDGLMIDHDAVADRVGVAVLRYDTGGGRTYARFAFDPDDTSVATPLELVPGSNGLTVASADDGMFAYMYTSVAGAHVERVLATDLEVAASSRHTLSGWLGRMHGQSSGPNRYVRIIGMGSPTALLDIQPFRCLD